MSGGSFEGRVRKVAEGRNGRLFSCDYGAPDNDDLLKAEPLPAWRLKQWRMSLEKHAGFLAERSIPLVMLVAPDAFTAWPDDLPEAWTRPVRQVGQDFADVMAGVPNLTVVYPLQAIWQAKGGLPTWKKHDTHWTAYGAFIAYRELLTALPADLPIRCVGADDVSYAWREVFGDLGAHRDFNRKLPVPRPTVDGAPPETVRRSAGVVRRSFEIVRNPAATARALIHRDSFANEMAPYLAATFGEMWSLGPSQEIDLDLVEEARPDVVIVQTSERRLVRQSPDHSQFGWRELFDIDMTSPAGKACGRMVETLENDGAEAAAHLAAEVAGADGAGPRHLVHCAQSCFRADRIDEAKAYARRAAELDPSSATAWRLVALAEIASEAPDEEVWAAAARRMLAAAPHNPRYRQDYASALDRFGRGDEAEAVLRAAIEAHPHFTTLRLQLGRQLRKAGDQAGAVEVLTAALELLHPDGQAYANAERLIAGGRGKG